MLVHDHSPHGSPTTATAPTSATAALPPGWTEHLSPDNTKYYYHSQSRTSSWTFPAVESSPPLAPARMAPAVLPPPPKRARSLSAINESLVQASPMRQRAQLESFREELGEKLLQRDGILESDVEHTLRQWIQVSDELGMSDAASEAAQLLSQNYVGSADLSAILESWLDVVRPSTGKDSVSLGKETTAQHLRELIWQRFERSVEPLDDLLMKCERPPVWLASLLDKKPWRALLIDLAAKHRSSPFLAFCIRAIAQAGFHSEVAATLSASTHFSVFKETIADALLHVLQAVVDGAALETCLQAEDDFLKIADSTLHAHAYAMELLAELEKPTRGLAPMARFILSPLARAPMHTHSRA